jgi:hypothetical protein
VVYFNFKADVSLFEHLNQKDKLKQAKTQDPKTQHTPLGEKQSEASFGSLILLYRLQLLFEES